MRWLAILFLMMALSAPALAVQPDEILKDPALESRARALSQELRCMVCQNQSIDDSDAPLAKDLRVLVRERLTAGDSDSQVMDFLVAHAPYSAGCSAALRAGLGAPTRNLRSDSESAPPSTITTQPNQISSTSGL